MIDVPDKEKTGTFAFRTLLILAASLVIGSVVVVLGATLFHATGADPNDHHAIFLIYARSTNWTVDHVAQFSGEAIGIVGVMVLFYALDPADGMARLVSRIGVVGSGAALALVAARLAVDGILLKRAVDAWASAPDTDKVARFASAETARWLEEAITSYQGFVLGATLILLAVLIVLTARVPRPIGYLLGLAGVGYLVSSWIIGESGFSSDRAIPSYVAVFLPPIVGVWLLINAWRMNGQSQPAVGSSGPKG